MGGRINEEDIAAVRDRARIEEIVGSYVTLRSAGGTMKGSAHSTTRRPPAFRSHPHAGIGTALVPAPRVATSSTSCARSTTSRLWRQSSGSPIAWAFSCATPTMEARPEPRIRMAEALRLAAEFFVEQLSSPDAVVARQFLSERGFDRQAAERFGVGFAPRDGRALLQHLRGADSTMWSWYLPDWHASLAGTSFRAA